MITHKHMETRMNRLVMVALIIALTGIYGCSFLMKEYDDRNERKLAELSEENRDLTSKVRELERKVPEMNQQIRDIGAENERLKQEVSSMKGGLSEEDAQGAKTAAAKPVMPSPAQKPETKEPKDPFALSETEETAPQRPAVQAPKSQLTPEAAKIMEMAKMKAAPEAESSVPVPKPEPKPEPAPTPKPSPAPAPEPAPTVKAEEAAPKSQLTPDAERIMAMARQKLGMGETTATEPQEAAEPEAKAEPEAMVAPKPEPVRAPEPATKPAPAPVAKPAPEPSADTSKLTPEAQRLIAMARGEEVSAEKTEAQASVKKAAASSVKLKVLSGTGNIASGHKMSKTLKELGYEAETVAMAPRSNFKQNTVYYSKGFKDTAEDIKSELGGDTIIKPLSWNSKFEIIVVAAE
jgi:outer membrane murein-binding lipoprotein Lpp